MDVMTALRERRAKAEAKVLRASKALEIAQKELIDVIAAERVMADITGESLEPKSVASPVSDRDKEITKLLSTSAESASTPAELHPAYIEATKDTLNLDAFRTALWRLRKKVIQGAEKNWTVRSQDGRYWREPASDAIPDFDQLLGGTDGAS
jgi:hypothetical protein